MIDQPASGDRHRSKGHCEQRPRKADLPSGGTTQVQQEAPADLVDTNDEARARVAHHYAEHTAVTPQHDSWRDHVRVPPPAPRHCNEHGHTGQERCQRRSDEQPAHGREADQPADERPDSEPDRPGPEECSKGAALLRRGHDLADRSVVRDIDDPGARTLQAPHQQRGDGRSDQGKGGARYREGHQAAQLDGSAPNPVRQSADRVLHEDGGKEEGRYHYSDEADRRAQLAKVEREERYHGAGPCPLDKGRD